MTKQATQGAMEKMIDYLRSDLNQRFDKVDATNEKIECKVDKLTEKFDAHVADDARNFAEMGKKVDARDVAEKTKEKVVRTGRAHLIAWISLIIALMGSLSSLGLWLQGFHTGHHHH